MYTPTQFDARREQMLKELASDMADLVASGDMTAEQANEWVASKADQWKEPS
jgi:polyhydroxyalkanoate synthesis regulator phasin